MYGLIHPMEICFLIQQFLLCFDKNTQMRKIAILLAAFFIWQHSTARAANKSISIQIINEQKQPIENATAELRRANDSALIKTAITDKNGWAEFVNIKPGAYLIKINSLNYSIAYCPVIVDEQPAELKLPAIILKAFTGDLNNVTVTAKKPFIQKLTDRIVVNVDNSIVNAGNAALDVLEKSPGVTIDQNDIISLRGKSGVIIMIDGKPSPMSGADLANYLRGLPSNAIDRIEIITNPSAKYDAAGNSGIIDIKMKKDQRLGTNGIANIGYGQGIYPKANAGINLNYRNKGVNIFGNYNYNYRMNLNHLILNRNFYKDGVFNGSDDKDNYAKMPVNFHSVRFGVDIFPGKKTIIGFVANSSLIHFERNNDNHSIVNDKSGTPYYRFNTFATNNDHNGNLVANINFKHTFKEGRELSADLDYGVFNTASLSRITTGFYDISGTPKSSDILDGDQDGKLTLQTGKVDYSHAFAKGSKFEAGFKTSYVTADNDAKFYNVLPSEVKVDSNKTNRFYYDEYNHAAYTNYSKDSKKFSVQIGLRAEQTKINTHQIQKDQRWDSSYLQFFPSAFFNYKLKEDKTVGVSVSRRIDRPGYSQLNPFLFLIDATTYATGKPELLPQLTWSYELSYTVKNMSFTLGYSHTKDPQTIAIIPILEAIPNFKIAAGADSNITTQIPLNLQSSDYFGLTATTPVKINKWWNMVNNVNVFYNHFNGNLARTPINNGSPQANIRTNNSFTFKKGWSAELNANYYSAGTDGYMHSKAQWGVAMGAQKTVMKGKGTVRFNVSDIFWTNLPRATVTYEGKYVENWHAYRETRVANLSFTYRFGNNKVQAARRKTMASEEEIRRAGGN
jgi:iron complex outermembrane recepter protein